MRRTEQVKRGISIGIIVAFGLLIGRQVPAGADSVSAPSLVIAQVKITSSNGQFITLYNTTGTTLDMSKFQLEYFNHYDLGKATSSRLIALSGMLPPHGFYMVNDSALQLCHQLTVNSVSLGFSSTAGFLGIVGLSQHSPGSIVQAQMLDYMSWSKTPVAGVQTLPGSTSAFLLRRPADSDGKPTAVEAGGGLWISAQPDSDDPCNIISFTSPATSVAQGSAFLLPATEPDVIFIEDPSVAINSAANPGKMAPLITELLPNPLGTGTDANDEFIELYNPNETTFDLTGYKLGAGSTSLRTYTFQTGVSLPPKSYVAYYSSQTKLSMSNAKGQAVLLEPSDNIIASTKQYATASDGQSWILAKGNWVWTLKPTPGTANILHSPPTKTKKSGAKSSSKKLPAQSSDNKGVSNVASTKLQAEQANTKTPVHTWALALVGAAALIYGLYEYRNDIAARIRKLGRNFGIGQKNRQQA